MNIDDIVGLAEEYLNLLPPPCREFEAQRIMRELIGALKSCATPCVWEEDEDGVWDTACGDRFDIIDGTPSENSMAFCHYCGHPIEERRREPNP
jgi:hypothetical protein